MANDISAMQVQGEETQYSSARDFARRTVEVEHTPCIRFDPNFES